jgi:hypothetical protein
MIFFSTTEVFEYGWRMKILQEKKPSASKNWRIEGTGGSAGTFYHTGEELVNKR